jgi:hypothetical protein
MRPLEWTDAEPQTARDKRLAGMTHDPPAGSHDTSGITRGRGHPTEDQADELEAEAERR